MKNKYFLLTILSLFCFSVQAQSDTFKLKFIDIDYNWHYVTYDSNFVALPDNPDASPYSRRDPIEIMTKNDNCYIMELVYSQLPGGFEGTLAHKLNYETGELQWINHNNSYSGNKYREIYEPFGFRFDDDRNLQMLGIESNDTISHQGSAVYYFYGMPILKTINDETGQFVDIKTCPDTMSKRINLSVNAFEFAKNSNGDYLRISFDVEIIDSILNERIDFNLIDEDFCLSEQPVKSIYHSSGLRTENSSLVYPPFPLSVSDDTILMVTGIKNPENQEFSPSALTLSLVDISDINDIHIIKEKEIIDDVNFPIYFGSASISIRPPINKNLILTQYKRNNDSIPETNGYNWLAWYDKELNKMAKIDYIHNENFYYRYLNVLGIANGYLYIAGEISNPNRGYDILRILPGDNNFEIVKRLEIEQDVRFSIFDGAKVVNDKKIIIPIRVRKSGHNYNHYYCFDLQALGMDYVSTKEQVKVKNQKMSIYPNPTQDMLTNYQAAYTLSMHKIKRTALYICGRSLWLSSLCKKIPNTKGFLAGTE